MDLGLVIVPSPQALRVSRMLDHPPDGLRAALVPDAGVEPATFGLQNRCSTN